MSLRKKYDTAFINRRPPNPFIVIFQLGLSLISIILFGEAIASKDNIIALDIIPSKQPDSITFALMLNSPHYLGHSENW